MDSTTAGTGDELVPTQEAGALWMDVNLETMVAPLFSRVEMPSNPFEIPLQLGDVNWFPGTENSATTSTALTTAKQTLTAYELVGQIPWSLTIDEDAVIAMAREVRGSLIHNAAVSDDMFNEIRGKLGKYGVRPSEVVYVTDINTYIKSLTVSNFRILDKLGPAATLLTGQLGAVKGIPVLVSEQMKLADTDGKVTDGSAGTTGRLLIANRSQWRIGFRRELSIETDRDIQKRQNIMVVSMRLAFAGVICDIIPFIFIPPSWPGWGAWGVPRSNVRGMVEMLVD